MREGVVPDEPRGRPGEGVHTIFAFAARVAPRKRGADLAFAIAVGDGTVRPLMAVGALHTATEGVVEQYELARQFVLVRRHLGPEDAQAGVAVALRQVAQHLVIRPVLLDDVDDVLEHAGLAHALGHRPGGLTRARRQPRFGDLRIAHVDQGGGGQRREFLVRGQRQQRERSEKVLRVQFHGRVLLENLRRADAFDVGDSERVALGVKRHRAGEPADRDQAEHLGLALLRVEPDHGDGVLRAVAHEEPAAVAVKGQRIRLRSERVGGRLASPDLFDHLVRPGVDHAERIAAGISDDDVAAIGRSGHGGGVQFHDQLRLHAARRQIDHRDGAFVSDVPHGIHPDHRARAGGCGQLAGASLPAAGVAHIGLAGREHDIERGRARVPGAQHRAGGGLEFEQLVPYVARNVEPLAIRRDREARGQFHLALRRAGFRDRQGSRRGDVMCLVDRENLDVADGVGEINVRAVRREDQARQAQLGARRRAQLRRRLATRRGVLRVSRQAHRLQHRTGRRIHHHNIFGPAGGHQQLAVGAEGEGLRAQLWQRHLFARWRQHLARRHDVALGQHQRGLLSRGRSGHGFLAAAGDSGHKDRKQKKRSTHAKVFTHGRVSLWLRWKSSEAVYHSREPCGGR